MTKNPPNTGIYPLDWKQINSGAVVYFNCGGQAKVLTSCLSHNTARGAVYMVEFEGGFRSAVTDTGQACQVDNHPFDIIGYEPPLEPRNGNLWVTVLETNTEIDCRVSFSKPLPSNNILFTKKLKWTEESIKGVSNA